MLGVVILKIGVFGFVVAVEFDDETADEGDREVGVSVWVCVCVGE